MITAPIEEICDLKQYICWWLGREPTQKDFNFLIDFLKINGATLIRGSRNAIDFRIFNKKMGSIHIIIRRKYFGIAINVHREIKIHSKVMYDEKTLFLNSRIYNFLNKLYYGNCFLLPRQIIDFENYLRYNKKKWNLI